MSTGVKIPRSADTYFLLQWLREGAALDLTGATLAASLKYSPDAADADAIALTTGASPGLTLTTLDALQGLAILKVKAAATTGLSRSLLYHLSAKATLADGDVAISEAHQLVVALTPLDPTLAQLIDLAILPVAGVDHWLEAGGGINVLPPAMSNYVLNRFDLTGLTGGTSTKLDGLSAATLSNLQNGTKLELSFTGDIELQYKLRAKGSDVEAAPFLIVCDNDTTRAWELTRVTKEGQPAVYNATSAKFHRVWAAGADGSATATTDASGFTIPT